MRKQGDLLVDDPTCWDPIKLCLLCQITCTLGRLSCTSCLAKYRFIKRKCVAHCSSRCRNQQSETVGAIQVTVEQRGFSGGLTTLFISNPCHAHSLTGPIPSLSSYVRECGHLLHPQYDGTHCKCHLAECGFCRVCFATLPCLRTLDFSLLDRVPSQGQICAIWASGSNDLQPCWRPCRTVSGLWTPWLVQC